MEYPHWVIIARSNPVSPGGGTQDDDGVFVDDPTQPDTTIIYDDRADVQDKGEALEVNTSGMPTLMSDGVVYLRDERRVSLVKENDQLDIRWEDGSHSTAQVMRVRRLDGSLLIRRITNG